MQIIFKHVLFTKFIIISLQLFKLSAEKSIGVNCLYLPAIDPEKSKSCKLMPCFAAISLL